MKLCLGERSRPGALGDNNKKVGEPLRGLRVLGPSGAVCRTSYKEDKSYKNLTAKKRKIGPQPWFGHDVGA